MGVSLVAVNDAPNICTRAKKSVDVSNKLANAMTMASMGACFVVTWAAVRRDGKHDSTMLRFFQHLFPTFLGAASAYFWQLSRSLLQAYDYLETSLVHKGSEPVCRHILFYHELPSWLPSGPQVYVVGFVIIIMLGLLPASLMALSSFQKQRGLQEQMPLASSSAGLPDASRRTPDPQRALTSAPYHLVSVA